MIKIYKLSCLLIFFLIHNMGWSVPHPHITLPEKSVNNEEGQTGQENRSETKIKNLNLNNASLKNTLRLLTTRLGKNLLIDPEVNDRNLNISLNNISPLDALNAILEANNLAYSELAGNVFFIARAEKIVKQTVVKNISCKYADAEALEKTLNSMVVSESGKILSDKRTNTLIIKESPDVLIKMEKLIEELDKPTKQVYIQAEIVELSTTGDKELGVEWLWKTANYKSVQGKVGTNFDVLSSSQANESNLENSEGFPFPAGTGLGIGVLNTDVNAVLHALNEVNKVNLLSRPRIITLDNQEAVIEVGDQIPFRKLNEFGVTSFEFKDATVKLLVKPQIIDSEFILLQVSPKADFQNGFTPDGTPIISTRKATTNVKVRDGQTIVIGGLIRDSILKSEKKVPILGSIPILGFLFKSQKSTKIKTELIVFITPIILKDDDTGDIFKDDLELKHNVKEKFK